MANVHKTPVERCETTRLRGRSARTWVCSIEIDLDKRDCEDTDWSARSVCQIQRVSERSEVSVPRRSSHKQDLGQGTFRLPTAAASGAKALQNQNVLCLWPARCTTESGHPRTQARRPRPTQSSSRTGTAKYFSLSIAMQRQEPGDVGSPSSVSVATRRAEVAPGSLAKDYHRSHL